MVQVRSRTWVEELDRDDAQRAVPRAPRSCEQEGNDSRHAVRAVVTPARRVVDAVPAAARRAPLQPNELRNQPRIVEQIHTLGVDGWQQCLIERGFGLGGGVVCDAVLAE